MSHHPFSVVVKGEESGYLVLAVSEDLGTLLICKDPPPGEPRRSILRRVSIAEVEVNGVYFGLDTQPWHHFFQRKEVPAVDMPDLRQN
jgi:hypothetical protein